MKKFLFLPTCLAGLGIRDPTKTAVSVYHSLKQGTQAIRLSVKDVKKFSVAEHLDMLSESVLKTRHTLKEVDLSKLNTLITTLSPERHSALKRAIKNSSTCMAVSNTSQKVPL